MYFAPAVEINWEIHFYLYFVGFYFDTCLKLVVTVIDVAEFRGIGGGGKSGNDEEGGIRGGGRGKWKRDEM